MGKYRNQLPQLSGRFFITNGGLETTLIYEAHRELPCFAAYTVLKDESGCEWMRNYLSMYGKVAQQYNVGLVLESATWRAHPDWLNKLGYDENGVVHVNRKCLSLLTDIRDEYETETSPIVLNASVGPRGDAYNPTKLMTPEQAEAYHAIQIRVLSQTETDMITGLTLNYPNEAIGLALAAKKLSMPVVISFTVEQDGKLVTGQTLREAIELVDKATDNTPIYYMVNCAHPCNFTHVFDVEEDWMKRIHGVKGNASKKSHAELDNSKELDAGNPIEFGNDNRMLLYKLKNLNVFGGCCGTNYHHVEEICKTCIPAFDQRARNIH